MLGFIRWLAWLLLPLLLRAGALLPSLPVPGPPDGIEIVLPSGGAWREQPGSPRMERQAQFTRIRIERGQARAEVIVLPDLGQSMSVAWCDGEYYAIIDPLSSGAESGIRRVDLDAGTSEAVSLPTGCSHLRGRSLCSDGHSMYAHNATSLWRLRPSDQPARLEGEIVYSVSTDGTEEEHADQRIAESIYPPAVTDEYAYLAFRDGTIREIRLSNGLSTREIIRLPGTSNELVALPSTLIVVHGQDLLRRNISMVPLRAELADAGSLEGLCEHSRSMLAQSRRLLVGAEDVFTIESGDKDDYTTIRSLMDPAFRVHIDGVDCWGPGVARDIGTDE